MSCYDVRVMRLPRGATVLFLWCHSVCFAQAPPASEYRNALQEAEAMRARGDMEGVVRTLLPWVEKYPDQAQAHHALGLAYYQQNNLASAIRHLSAALKLEPESSRPWKQTVETLAMAYYFSSRTQDALPLLEKAVTWNPGDAYYSYALAMSYVYARDLDGAKRLGLRQDGFQRLDERRAAVARGDDDGDGHAMRRDEISRQCGIRTSSRTSGRSRRRSRR